MKQRSSPRIFLLAIIVVAVSGAIWIYTKSRPARQILPPEETVGGLSPVAAAVPAPASEIPNERAPDPPADSVKPLTPFQAAHAEQYKKFIAAAAPGSPLANLVHDAYDNSAPQVWNYAERVMAMYQKLLSSPEDYQQGPTLVANIQQALAGASPDVLARVSVWPTECRTAMCLIQVSESPGEGPSANALINSLGKVLQAKDANGELLFTGVRGQSHTGDAFLWLMRPGGPSAAPGPNGD